MTERTFSIIKPDAVKRNLIGAILGRFESQGFRVVAQKMVYLGVLHRNLRLVLWLIAPF